MQGAGLTYGGLKYKAQALEPLKGYSAGSRFLLATSSLVESNQVHVIELNEEDEEIVCVNVYPHSNAVTCIAASPDDDALLLTSYVVLAGATATTKVTMWRLSGDEANSSLEAVSELPAAASLLLWDATAPDIVFTADATHLRGWNAASTTQQRASFALGEDDNGSTAAVGGLSINPHFSSLVAVCFGTSILAFDLREQKSVWRIDNADPDRIRDLDFNPNRPYYLCAGGDEGAVQFWDYRKAADGPVSRLNPPHSHWVSSVEYNPHHDSLVLSAGTDCVVNLYNAKSVSSESGSAATGASGGAATAPATDYLIASYERYSQSVYRACWSSADAWVYAHLCYDGKAVVSSVSEQEKLKILL